MFLERLDAQQFDGAPRRRRRSLRRQVDSAQADSARKGDSTEGWRRRRAFMVELKRAWGLPVRSTK
jgi:hypothetical protein